MSSIFISHATENKDAVARPIAEALRKRGYSVWYDEYSLKLGDSLRRSIDNGLAKCAFGVVILSKDFFAKQWPQKELDALTTREASEGNKIVLPVWHKISAKEVASFSPLLADKIATLTERGLEKVLQDICDVVGPPNNPKVPPDEPESLVYSFADQSVIDWKKAIQKIFNNSPFKSSSWSNREEIIHVLSQVAESTSNHCFIPSGGGMDLERVQKSVEDGCIELLWDSRTLVLIKPRVLQFENFPGFPSMSYFRIEADKLLPAEKSDDDEPDRMFEELVEISPGDYRDRWFLDAGYCGHDENGYEIPIPESARSVMRYFRGSFVIFAKGSLYNHLKGNHDAYNAQHEKMGAKEFRNFISKIIHETVLRGVELEPDRR